MQNQAIRAAHPSSLIADLAAHARSGYSLDRQFYCDDEVFAADMRRDRHAASGSSPDTSIGCRNKGDYFLFKIGDESIIIVRSDEIDHQCLLQRVPAPRLADLHQAAGTGGAPDLRLSRVELRARRRAARRPADAGGFLQGGQRPAPLPRAGVPRLHFHQPIRCRSRWISMRPSGTSRPTSISTALPMRRSRIPQSYPTDGELEARSSRTSSSATTARRRTRNSVPCIRREALVAFGAGPSSGPADAVDKYLPTLKAWEARAAALGRPIGTRR